MDPTQKRLMKELRDYQKNPNEQVVDLRPVDDDNLYTWEATIVGQEDTPYQGGRWRLAIEIPKNYPIQPPTIKFITPVCHPNVHMKTGEICLDLLKTAWSPAWTLQSACLAVAVLLTQPEPNSPLNCDAANLLRCNDQRGYNSLVRLYTRKYAMDS